MKHHPVCRTLLSCVHASAHATALLASAFTLSVAATLTAPAAYAQTAESGVITGRVQDADTGNYLEGAEVSVAGTSLRVSTEREGVFTLTGVPAGVRTLTVSYIGLESHDFTVNVAAGQTASLQAELTSGVVTLSAMKVTTVKEGMAHAVAVQKVSIQTKTVVANDQFGPVSEGNIGEYLKFIPGVSIDYNVNDARGVSLRGLSTAFTIVSVDGTPMAGASSTDDTRRFEFEQIAMNNVETTELYKTVTPDIPATATGGFVNFVTKSAFDYSDIQRVSYDLYFSAPSSNVSLERQTGAWGHKAVYTIRPSLEVNVGRKLTPKIGVNFNYRLSEKYDDSPRTEFTWNTTKTSPTVFTDPVLQQYNIRSEEKLTHREAFASKLDYHISDQTKLMLSAQWNWYDLNFTQRGPQFVLGTAATHTGNDYTSGTGAQIQDGTLYREKYGTTWHFNANLSHEFKNDSKLSITPYYSKADGQYRDTSKGFISATAVMAPSASTYTNFTLHDPNTLGTLPTITINRSGNDVPLDLIRNIGNYTLSNTTGTNFQSRPWTANDLKKGARLDYSIPLHLFSTPVTIATGYEHDDTHRDINRPDFRGNIPATTGSALTALIDPGYHRDVALGFGSIQTIDPYKVWNAFSDKLTFLSALDQRDIKEGNDAAYVRGDVELRKDLLLVTGVRWEKRTMDAQARTGAPNRARQTIAKIDYDDWYPSLTLKYTPKNDLVLRTGVSRTVGIPDYSEILPSFIAPTTPSATDGTISVPSSHLKPYTALNFDVSADYYLKNSGVITVAAFRKQITDFIIARPMTADERTNYLTLYGLNAADFGSTGGTVRENGSKSSLQGMEFSYAQNMTFLPKPFNGLSVQANFTFINVKTSDADPYRALDTEYSQLRGVTPRTANLILGYRLGRWNSSLTANWVSESLYGGFVNTNYFTGTANTANPALDTRLTLNKDEKTTLDFKIEFAATKNISAYFLIRNLTNSPRKEFLKGYLRENRHVNLPLRYFEFGEPHLTIGVRGTF